MDSPSLADLRNYVRAASTKDDAELQKRLTAATEWIHGRIYPEFIGDPVVNEAILLQASRLYGRKKSPEGVAGFASEGYVVRITRWDPDVKALLDRFVDYSCDSESGLGIG